MSKSIVPGAPLDQGKPLSTQAWRGTVARETQPVVYWAVLGAALVAFWGYLMLKWVSGPYFTPTLPGPTEQPDWMYPMQVGFQAACMIGFAIAIYHLLVKPWLRTRQLATDGAFFIAYVMMFFLQDQLSCIGGSWYLYNAHVFNMGTWFTGIPGWMAYAEPGHALPEPIFMMAPGYAFIFALTTFVGCRILREFRQRWPTLAPAVALLAVVLATALIDILFERGIWMPLGFYVINYTPAGLPTLDAGGMLQFPLLEALVIGLTATGIALLRYHTDDKGHTFVERGIDKVTASRPKQAVLRLLAIIAATQLIYFFFFNVPMGIVGLNSRDWPEAVQQRSYLLDGLCGANTDRACPTDDTPLPRFNHDHAGITVSPDGKLVVPADARLPRPVPLLDKPKGML